MDVLKRNADRLALVTPLEVILEVLKNCMEHGSRTIKIEFESDCISFFNTMDDLELNKFTFEKLQQKLTTFASEIDTNFETNFHEGLSCLLKYKFH
jgi:hypothetical protein